MIRPATHDDLAAIVEIIMSAHGRMSYARNTPEGPEVDSVINLLLDAMDNNDAELFVADVGGEVIGACGVGISTSPWNRKVLVGTEAFWHMREDHYGLSGRKWFLRMLGKMRLWVKGRGASWFVCVTPPGVTGTYLEKKGFSLVENTYGEVL